MKKLLLILFVLLIAFACNNTKKQQPADDEPSQKVTAVSVDELYKNAAELEGKEVVVKGTVMHVCKHGGARCFLMGSNEDINIRVEAGEKIGAFKQEQMGSKLEITGILKAVKTEADAHNPGQEHGNGEHAEDDATENAHKTIAAAQESVEVVYFIEGLQVKEL